MLLKEITAGKQTNAAGTHFFFSTRESEEAEKQNTGKSAIFTTYSHLFVVNENCLGGTGVS